MQETGGPGVEDVTPDGASAMCARIGLSWDEPTTVGLADVAAPIVRFTDDDVIAIPVG
jgi:hypothetical protein